MADRVAVITGAGSGIGRASALELCKGGWSVALLGRRRDALEETASLASGGKTLPLPTDVSDPDQVIAAFAAVKEKFGRVDMLFNNAGGNVPSTNFGDFTWEMWRRVVAVNLDAMFMCANQAFRMMRDQTPRGGRIINNGSISAHVPRPGSVAYTSTKHGVTGLTKSIALDGREFDICSGQIDIGNAATPMTARSTNGQMQPYGQMAVEARMDVAHVGQQVAFMANLPLEFERPVRHDHGDQDAVHRSRLSDAGAAPVWTGLPWLLPDRSGIRGSTKEVETQEVIGRNLARARARSDDRWDPNVQGDPLWRSDGWIEPLPRSQAGGALDRSSRRPRLWSDLSPGTAPTSVFRGVLGNQIDHERGLPGSEHLDSGVTRPSQTTSHGLASRWRLFPGFRREPRL